MARTHRALRPAGRGDYRAGGGHPRPHPPGRRPRTARNHPRDRRTRRRRIRSFGRGLPQGRRGGSRPAEGGDRNGPEEYRGVSPGAASAGGIGRDDAGRTLRATGRADPARGALRPGRKGPVVLHRTDARPAGPRGRMPRGGALHPGRPRRRDRPGDPLCGNVMRREAHLRPGRRPGHRRHGLRHGERSESGQDLRTR